MRAYVKRLLPGIFTFCLVLVALSTGAVAQTGGSPRLRVVHASPNAPAADVYIDGNLIFRNLPYRGITDYAVLSPGNHVIRIVPAGAGGPVVLEPTLPIVDGKDYTLLIVGKLDNLQAQQLEDDNSPPAEGKTRVRFIHASPDTPAIDVCLIGQQDCPITNLTFKNASGYVVLDGGVFNFDIRRTGTNEVLLTQRDLTLSGGTVYSLFLMGLLQGQPGLQVIAKNDAGRPPIGPPVTGAFLSPPLLTFVVGIMVVLVGGWWFVRWRFVKG